MASRIASAMTGTVLLTSHAMAEGFWRQSADGWIYIPDELVIGVVVAVCLGLLYAIPEDTSSSSSVTWTSLDPPEEIQTPESVKYYEEMIERTRALKHKLDADTELTESYIKATRARAELEDLDSEARRRGRGRQ